MAAASRLLRAARSYSMMYRTTGDVLGMYPSHFNTGRHSAVSHTAALYQVHISTIGAKIPPRTSHNLCSHSLDLGRLVHDDRNLVTVLDDLQYHKLADETLEELGQFFEDLGDAGLCPSDYDVSLANGVLTINVGGKLGTYVVNKQSPNKQIWLSSPKSGPKRYDVIKGRWRYSHDGSALHDLLSKEFSELLDNVIDLSDLMYSHIISDGESWS